MLQSQQPALYENLTTKLGPEEKQVLEAAVHHADEIVQQAAQVQAGAVPPANGVTPA